MKNIKVIILAILVFLPSFLFAKDHDRLLLMERITRVMEKENIPGLTIILVKDNQSYIENLGFDDVELKKEITDTTRFTVFDLTQGFTSLAILQLEEHGKVSLGDDISKYFPEFKGKNITIKNLLYHTSGIDQAKLHQNLTKCSEKCFKDSIISTSLQAVKHDVGHLYKYSPLNYELVGLIIEKVTGHSYPDYMRDSIFIPLGLKDTYIKDKVGMDSSLVSMYKESFFGLQKQPAHDFIESGASIGLITTPKDLSKWIKHQVHLIPSEFHSIISKSQTADLSVYPTNGTIYSAMGWDVNNLPHSTLFNSAFGPASSTYVQMYGDEKIGIAIMMNAKSSSAVKICEDVLKTINADYSANTTDKVPWHKENIYLVLSLLLVIYSILLVFFLGMTIFEIKNGKRAFEGLSMAKSLKFTTAAFVLSLLVIGVYLIPTAMSDLTWKEMYVWESGSIELLIRILKLAFIVSVLSYVVSEFFPRKNKYHRGLPLLGAISVLSGLANTAIILIITSALRIDIELQYLIFYFLLAFVIYIFGRKVVQSRQIDLTLNIIYDLLVSMVDKLLTTSYQDYEKIDKSRIYATLNHDIGVIGGAANVLVGMISGFITMIFAFVVMFSMSVAMSSFVIVTILVVVALHLIIGKAADKSWSKGRELQGVFYKFVDGIVNGFKELSLNNGRRKLFSKDIHELMFKWYRVSVKAHIQHMHVFLVGESLVINIIGVIGLLFPIIFPETTAVTISAFIIILLYIISPINNILGAVPQIMQFKVGWRSLKSFLRDIPASLSENDLRLLDSDKASVKSYELSDVMFEYKSDNDRFRIGPINLEARKGEIVFIIGGNGSGKTTLAKVITGLYKAQSGDIKLNGNSISNILLSQYFSVVYSDYYLFDYIHSPHLNDEQIQEKADAIIKLLDLEGKVELKDRKFSTTKLSSGQRKRLALMTCYIEDNPIYLFDEWASDQDPTFKKYFYEYLLPKMREEGKIIFVISHDEKYFHIADQTIRMEFGEIVKSENEEYDLVKYSY